MKRALHWPTRAIVANAGGDGAIDIGRLLEKGDTNFGVDAQKGEYVDMFKAGIVDSTKVMRLALQDAASVAGLLITTEVLIAEKPRRKSNGMAIPAESGFEG